MPLRVTLTTPERLIFEGLPAEAVVAPAADGELGILPGHTALIALLGTGELRVTSGGKVRRYAVDWGFLEVVRDTVTLLAERALAAGRDIGPRMLPVLPASIAGGSGNGNGNGSEHSGHGHGGGAHDTAHDTAHAPSSHGTD